MNATLRLIMSLAAAATLLGTLALGALWLRDRTHRWEPPRWEAESFVLLRGEAKPRGGPRTGTAWVAPINPRCGHCLTTLRRLYRAWSIHAPAAPAARNRLIALIVDTPARPSTAELRSIPPVAVWWDPNNIWRRRWGHRLYGELIEFDPSGRFVRSAPANQVLLGATSSQPIASATRPHGGFRR